MSLLSDLAQVALKSALGGNAQNQSTDLVAGVLNMLQNNAGGIAGLVDKFTKTGAGDAAASWVGSGENKPVTPEQVVEALGQDQVADLAKQAGIPEEKGAEVLSQVLPNVVNEMTPDGKIPEQKEMSTLAKVILGGLGVAGVAVAAKAAASAFGNDDQAPEAQATVENEASSSTAAAAAAPSTGSSERTYTVVSGDSLSKIAKHIYGDANRWMQIFEANRDKLNDPDKIFPGQVLRIP